MSKTDPPGRHVIKVREGVTSADCANDPEPTPRGRAAEQTSAIGLSLLAHERPTWVGQQPSAAQLSATFAAFDDRPVEGGAKSGHPATMNQGSQTLILG